ncbi:MAG: hypothetical protein ACRDHM_08690 [Actinomycetota bacterium]
MTQAVHLVLSVLFIVAFSMVPTSAHASTAARVGDRLLIEAEPGEVNRILASAEGNVLRINDSAGIEPGPGCSRKGNGVECRVGDIVLVSIVTGDLNDTVRIGGVRSFIDAGTGDDTVIPSSRAVVIGGPGRDVLRAGAARVLLRGGADGDVLEDFGGGRDVLKGGAGDDYLDSQDYERDFVFGGSGDDESGTNCGDRVRNVESGVVGCA